LQYWFCDLPRESCPQDRNHPHLVLIGAQEISGDGPLRVRLYVHEDAPLTDFHFGARTDRRFVKPTVDHLWPVIGIDPAGRYKDRNRIQGKDDRIRHLLVTRSAVRGSGVRVVIESADS
jgi:hypothetical protein